MKTLFEYLAIVTCLLIIVVLGVWAYYLSQFKAVVQYVRLPEAKIAYYTRGEGDPLVLLEGFGMSMEDWDPALIKKLSENNKIIIFDFRGVGLSSGKTDGLSIQQMSDDTFNLLDQLHVGKADVMGWSMGSLVAQEMAIQHPERINKLILASTFSSDSHSIDGSKEIGEYVQKNLDENLDVLITTMFPTSPIGQKAMKSYLKRREIAIKSGESPKTPDEDLQVKIHQEEAMGRLHETKDRLGQIANIKAPTLVLAGQDDQLIPVENDKMIARAILGAKLVIFPDSGHAFLFRDTHAVTDEIERFLH